MPPQHRHNEFVGYRVYTAQRALSRSLEKTLSPFDITPSEWNALNQLEHHGPLSQRGLAEALQKEQATITRSVDRMVRKGLVTREPDPHDRRANVIALTPAADDLLTTIEPTVVEASHAITNGIDPDDLATFFDVLERIQQNAQS